MNRWGAAVRLVGVGFYIGISIVLGVLAGLWLDKRLGTGYLVIIGLFCGIFVAGYGVYRLLIPFLDDRNKKGDS